jgi:hypothetical protein
MVSQQERMNVELLVLSEESDSGMVLRMDEHARIENPRNYSPQVMEELWALLRKGVEGRPDRRRQDFYELEGDHGTFYIHISPVNATVMLLAWWTHRPVAQLITSTSQSS